ncbi:MAG: ribonuclease H-like domain-containing protein [Candidatus Latescibacterota bacterium]|nr:MAG: ribonuclease H-like domain-containing protein [Candidatus Latescibacterota bacterium]
MDNVLRKRLAIIKNRAKQLKDFYGATRTARHPEVKSPCRLADAAPGKEHTVESSRFYLVRTDAETTAEEAPAIAGRFEVLARAGSWVDRFLGQNEARKNDRGLRPERVCYFDIETTGLTPNTYVFLCGFMYVHDGRFIIEQAFARDYSEEIGVLRYTRETLGRFDVLVTFNGTTFDVPFVKTRMTVGKIDHAMPKAHIDLLGPARKTFGKVLPNCKLGTIERHLRGIERTGDIPGSEIPEAYHDFVRTGDAQRIKRILYHNRMDLVTMGILLNHLAT